MKLQIITVIVLALSCSANIQKDNTNNNNEYLSSYFGKYYVEGDIYNWSQNYSPNLTVILILYSNYTCEVRAGVLEWPYITEYDKLELRYNVTDSGLTLFESTVSDPVFTISAIDMQPNLDPKQDLVNYLGPKIEMHWIKSLGTVWDTFSKMALWPYEITLDWAHANIDDIYSFSS